MELSCESSNSSPGIVSDISSDSADSLSVTSSQPAKRAKKNHTSNRIKVEKDTASEVESAVPDSTRKLLSILEKVEKISELKLYSFVSYDKHDSLIYLPGAFARLTTCNDVTGYAKLLKQYCAKDCTITLSQLWRPSFQRPNDAVVCVTSHPAVPFTSYSRIFELSGQLHPDSLCGLQTTQIQGNQIVGDLSYQYTDIPEMYSLATTFVTDPAFRLMFTGDRRAILRRRFHLDSMLAERRAVLEAVIARNEPLSVTTVVRKVITFDPMSQKVVDLQIMSLHTSITHNNISYSLL